MWVCAFETINMQVEGQNIDLRLKIDVLGTFKNLLKALQKLK